MNHTRSRENIFLAKSRINFNLFPPFMLDQISNCFLYLFRGKIETSCGRKSEKKDNWFFFRTSGLFQLFRLRYTSSFTSLLYSSISCFCISKDTGT